jgi:hypothetical protein
MIYGLCRGINLIVILAARKACQLPYIVVKPRRRVWKKHITTLEFRRLRVQTQTLVRSRRRSIGFDPQDSLGLKILNQLRTGRFVLDENDIRIMKVSLLLYSSLEIREIEASTENVEQIIAIISGTPGRANAEIVKLAALICRVPALKYADESFGEIGSVVALVRLVSESASSGFSGSSRIMMSAPRPVKTPPTEVDIRKPFSVVMNSPTDCFSGESLVPGNSLR